MMDSVYQPSDFDILLSDLCDDTWDSTSKESTIDTGSQHSRSPVTVQARKAVRLDSRGNRTVKIRNGDEAYDFEVHFPRPRIVSTDIRRSFGNIFVNVMNSGDFPLMFGFLSTFFCPNIMRISRKTYVSEIVPYKSSSQEGVLDIAQHWYNSTRFAPDTVVSLHNTRLYNYSDGEESKLVTGIKLECTRVFDEQMSSLLKNEPSLIQSTVVSRDSSSVNSSSSSSSSSGFVMSSVYNTNCRSNSSSSNESDSDVVGSKRRQKSAAMPSSGNNDDVHSAISSAMNSVHQNMSTLTLREQPVRLVGVGELCMYFNSSKSITRMEMSVRVDLEENYKQREGSGA